MMDFEVLRVHARPRHFVFLSLPPVDQDVQVSAPGLSLDICHHAPFYENGLTF